MCGGLRWFVVVCGGLWWFVVDCGGLSFSHTLIDSRPGARLSVGRINDQELFKHQPALSSFKGTFLPMTVESRKCNVRDSELVVTTLGLTELVGPLCLWGQCLPDDTGEQSLFQCDVGFASARRDATERVGEHGAR